MKKFFALIVMLFVVVNSQTVLTGGEAARNAHETFAIEFDSDSGVIDTVGPIPLERVTHFTVGWLPNLLTGIDSSIADSGFFVDVRTSFSTASATMSIPETIDSTLTINGNDTLRITTGKYRKSMSFPASKFVWFIIRRYDTNPGNYSPSDNRVLTISTKKDEPVK